MIVATFKKTNKHITSVITVGHANYAPHGQDIVCAAVSAVITGLLNEMERYSTIKYHAKSGDVELEILNPSAETDILMEFVQHTLEDVEREYPNNVKIVTE